MRRMLVDRTNAAIPLESLLNIDYLKASESTSLNYLVDLLVHEPEINDWGIEVKQRDFEGCSSINEVISHLHQMFVRRMSKDRLGQNTPRFVHLVRDPRVVVSSLIRSDVHNSNAYDAARRWIQDVSYGLTLEELAPEHIIRLTYEELIQISDSALKQISEFLGLAVVSNGLSLREDRSEYSTIYDSIHSDLDKPIHHESLDRWSGDLSLEEVTLVEEICDARMTELGYQSSRQDYKTRRLRLAYYQIDRVLGLLKKLIKYLRFRPAYLFYIVYRKLRPGLILGILLEINH